MTTTYTFDDCCYGDLYKDVFGCRPSQAEYQWWAAASDDEKQTEWEWLVVRLGEVMDEEARRQQAALDKLNAKITELISMGANSTKQAAEWLVQSFQDDYMTHDIEYADYHFGVKYGTFRGLLAQ